LLGSLFKQNTPSKTAELIASLVSLIATVPSIALTFYAVYLCVKPIFENQGILLGILSVFPFGPLVTAVQSITFAWNGNLLPLGLFTGAFLTSVVLGPIGAAIVSLILGGEGGFRP
jgi:hypothetical protein